VKTQKNRRQAERGVALVIAIFTLMLISVVATALVLMAGTETALKGNYKSAMHAFYDAKAGLEEGRGRLWSRNPSSIANCVLPGAEAMMQVNQVCYILNPSAGEVVNPLDLSAGNPYADNEYATEWGTAIPGGAGYNIVMSNSPIASANIAGPLYKWVRITPRTEASSNLDVDGDGDATDRSPLFYDGMQQLLSSGGQPVPGATQVLTVTALAVTPYGSRRMVQYTVALAGSAAALANLPSALTLDGNGVSFTGPSGGSGSGGPGNFQIVGKDINAPSGTQSGVPAIGYTNSSDGPSVSKAAVPSGNYLSPTGVPNVGIVTLPPILQTPSGLENLVSNITQNADLVLNPPQGTPADQTSLPSAMSASNPMVVVVNGDFNLHGNGIGYGLLVVTGTLDYDPGASWNGVILVIGQGTFTSSKTGTGVINGAIFVAQTLDATGNLLPKLGYSSFTQTGGGSGIQYSSNWVKAAQALMPYQVLSFREIAQTTP
jgi:hypothetical protein